jgi:hypothetical protein
MENLIAQKRRSFLTKLQVWHMKMPPKHQALAAE